MVVISAIRELPNIILYLESRQIYEQYIKAKQMIIGGYAQKYDFKIRQPKDAEIYQFRINKKYRAFGFFRKEGEKNIFFVTKIHDHQ